MRSVYVIGVDTLRFGRYFNRSIKDLTALTVSACLKDASITKEKLEAVWFSNAGWGESHKQTSIRGQVALRPIGIEEVPITNVENACAGGGTAFHHAWLGVASGLYNVTLAVGAEKTFHPNKYGVFAAFLGGLDTENLHFILEQLRGYTLTQEEERAILDFHLKYATRRRSEQKKRKSKKALQWTFMQRIRGIMYVFLRLGETIGYRTLFEIIRQSVGDHSPFMDVYAYAARWHMQTFGSTIEQLATIASKNHFHASLNPRSQYQFILSEEEILADRMIAYPLTRSMCAPIGDGAASAILADRQTASQWGLLARAVKIRASILASGMDRRWDEPDIARRNAPRAYTMASIGPEDVDVAEVHDATAYGELLQSESLGFFHEGEGGKYAQRGETKLGGKKPLNPSGGLLCRGHPVGASGLAQIHEIVTQLRGEAGLRQVEKAKIGLAENGGGTVGMGMKPAIEEAALAIHLFEGPPKK